MTDRELLEKAAKAMGYVPAVRYSEKTNSLMWFSESGFPTSWRPFDDDADAFKLLVQLRLGIVHGWESFEEQPLATVWISHDGQCLAEEIKGDDPYAATRRAIVRAAAAIGETK